MTIPLTIGEILDLATRLGGALAEQPRFRAVRDAESEVLADSKSRGIAERLEDLRERVGKRDRAGESRSAMQDDLDALQRIEEEVRADPKLQNLARAQADFAQMMNEVHGRIYAALSAGDEES
ncbi:MAG: YlbF family regulator [Planctomycetes bacterium]|nr:YlbF family regulator [Planctomycetota bacterium]MBI3846908.1 YlbF family regulator [Planctomycetota bacterium]